jgi:hypothetical protein
VVIYRNGSVPFIVAATISKIEKEENKNDSRSILSFLPSGALVEVMETKAAVEVMETKAAGVGVTVVTAAATTKVVGER